LLCTLFTGSLPGKNIENNFGSRLLAQVKLPVNLGPHRHRLFRVALVAFFKCALDADIPTRYGMRSAVSSIGTSTPMPALTACFECLQRIASFSASKP
jgi:hypothetical protein